MSQPFTEMKPAKKAQLAVIVRDVTDDEYWQCGICEEWIEERTECAVCGRGLCSECDTDFYTPPDALIRQTNLSLCKECSKLPRDVQDAAYALRKALNA